MIFTIGMRELKSLFLSPLAWSILAVVQLILAYLFLGRVEVFQMYQSQLMAMDGAPGLTEIVMPDLLGNAAVILLLVVPLLTMRMVAEERRNRTLSLLFSAPPALLALFLGFFAGFLLYISTSDILPEAHSAKRPAAALVLMGLTCLGAAFIFVVVRVAG